MKNYCLAKLVFLVCFSIGSFATQGKAQDETEAQANPKNSVVVMGMIHSKHRQSGPFDIEHLKELIRQIKPDYVLTEIPPDRLGKATTQFRETGSITESRIKVFPEYTDALFPLTKELAFEIIPCAAWTKEMNDSRRATLRKLNQTKAAQSAEVAAAQNRAGQLISAMGVINDPMTIHTDIYDQYVKRGMEPYDRYFNDEIGEGGWTNINKGHYGLIEKALNKHTGEGKRFLITFGSWHKYFIKEQLARRKDIELIPMSRFLDENASPSNWPKFRFNSSGSNAYGITEINSPEVHWRYDTGDVIESSAVVAGGTVYVGGHAKNLHAIDQTTGKEKWKFETGGWVRATPSVAGGMVYFGSDDNKFYALDAATGEKVWDFGLGEGGEQSSPLIEDGVVYFGAFDNFVYALNAKTGDLVWKFDAGASMLSSPTFSDGTLFIGTYGGELFALDVKSGEQKWKFGENEKPIFSSPVVRDGVVVFTSYDRHIYGLNVGDGSTKWKYETGGEIFSSPTVVGERVYFGSNDRHLYALNFGSGDLAWKRDLGGAVFSSPAISDRTVYVGSSDGHLYAVDRQSGEFRWRFLVAEGVKVWTSPIAINGKIYFGSHAGELIVLKEKE